MTAAELHRNLLLWQALEVCEADGNLWLNVGPDGEREEHRRWHAIVRDSRFCMRKEAYAPTLTAALTALLRDLGVEPVTWPIAVPPIWLEHSGPVLNNLLVLARRDPMTALALLFGAEG